MTSLGKQTSLQKENASELEDRDRILPVWRKSQGTDPQGARKGQERAQNSGELSSKWEEEEEKERRWLKHEMPTWQV